MLTLIWKCLDLCKLVLNSLELFEMPDMFEVVQTRSKQVQTCYTKPDMFFTDQSLFRLVQTRPDMSSTHLNTFRLLQKDIFKVV